MHGLAQTNHPDFRWSASLLVFRELLRHGPALPEIANKAVDGNNQGDAAHPSSEAM